MCLPWMNNVIIQLMKKRDMALKKSRKSKLQTDMTVFKGLRNKVSENVPSSFHIITTDQNNIPKMINHLNSSKAKDIFDLDTSLRQKSQCNTNETNHHIL